MFKKQPSNQTMNNHQFNCFVSYLSFIFSDLSNSFGPIPKISISFFTFKFLISSLQHANQVKKKSIFLKYFTYLDEDMDWQEQEDYAVNQHYLSAVKLGTSLLMNWKQLEQETDDHNVKQMDAHTELVW